ncbi:hypothetical protein FKM82_008048 [Ascaphus truei]
MHHTMLYIQALAFIVGVFNVEKAAGYTTIYKCTTLDSSMKENCGFEGIAEQECNSMGCCFDSSDDSIPCFKASGVVQDGSVNTVDTVEYRPAQIQTIPAQNVKVVHVVQDQYVPPKEKSACEICREQGSNSSPGLIGSAFELVLGRSESRACAQCRKQTGLRKDPSLFGLFG